MCKEEQQNPDDLKFKFDSPVVTTTLSIQAEIINRLATNSNYCKTLAITLSGAVVALSNGLLWPKLVLVCIVILVLGYLDALFIGLKKQRESISKEIIDDVKNKPTINPYDTALKNGGGKKDAVLRGIKSSTIWPFYLAIILGMIGISFFL